MVRIRKVILTLVPLYMALCSLILTVFKASPFSWGLLQELSPRPGMMHFLSGCLLLFSLHLCFSSGLSHRDSHWGEPLNLC